MAYFRKRGDKQWEARIRRKGYPNCAKTFDTKAEAEAWAREIESEMFRGVFVPRKDAERTTLNELLQRYLDDHVPTLAWNRDEVGLCPPVAATHHACSAMRTSRS